MTLLFGALCVWVAGTTIHVSIKMLRDWWADAQRETGDL